MGGGDHFLMNKGGVVIFSESSEGVIFVWGSREGGGGAFFRDPGWRIHCPPPSDKY